MSAEHRLDFIVAGPQRTATSWLDANLRTRPEICVPAGVKETLFFDRYFDRGMEWYWSHFRSCEGSQVIGEVAPSYFDVPEAIARIRAVNPECRIILSLRDPAERSFSLYRHHLAKGRVSGTFRDAVAAMPRIVDSSRYSEHVPRWLQAFGEDRVLVILQEDVQASPGTALATVLRFLGVDVGASAPVVHERVGASTMPRFPTAAAWAARAATWLRGRRMHGMVELAKKLGARRIYTGHSGGIPQLTPEDRRWLLDEFSSDTSFVETLLARSIPGWHPQAESTEP